MNYTRPISIYDNNKKEPEQPISTSGGIHNQIKELNEKIEALVETRSGKKQQKLINFPFGVKSQFNTLAKKNKVMVILLQTNRNITPIIAKIQDGLIEINGKYHNCSTDFIYLWQGKTPTIVLPEWSLNPIGTKDYHDAISGGMRADPEGAIIRMIETAQIGQGKTKISGKMIIGIIIGMIVIGYILFANQ